MNGQADDSAVRAGQAASPVRSAVPHKALWTSADHLLIAVLALASVAFFVRMTQLSDGDFLNSYPFISSDGFDWIYEGHWIVARLSGIALPPLLILRNPVFVAVTATDAWLSANGRVIALALAGAVFGAHLAMFGIARILRVPRLITASFVIASFVAATGYYRTWILSDSLAVCFMVVSVWGLVEYRLGSGRLASLIAATCAAAAGGLTQSYALIPFFVGVGLFSAEVALRERRVPRQLLACVLVNLFVTAGATVMWRSAIPHQGVPDQWNLLKPTLAMTGFYVDMWSFALLPFVPLLVVCFSWKALAEPAVLLFGAIVAAFVVITFFYQWADARFTDIYAPLLTLGAMAITSKRIASFADRASAVPVVRLAVLTAAFLAVQGLALAPASDWSPRWSQVVLRPADTWVGEWGFTAKPVDRFGLKATCASSQMFCDQVAVPAGYDPYASRIMSDFLAYKRRAQASSGR